MPGPLKNYQGTLDSFANHVEQLSQRSTTGDYQHLRTMKKPLTVAVGCQDAVYCHNSGDTGVFGTLFQVWANHWNLRTSPDDWWLPLVTKVAMAVYKCANQKAVRQLFVGGRAGKMDLVVMSDSWTIYDTEYSKMFSAFSEAIEKNVHVPDYVEAVTSSFTTTSPCQHIASQVTLMKSFRKYFNYRMMPAGCGIHGLEMVGTEQDWASLPVRLGRLRTLLKPIERTLNLGSLFTAAEEVFTNLHRTYVDGASMRKWWADVLIKDRVYEYGPSGYPLGWARAYNGWAGHFFAGTIVIRAQTLATGEYAHCLSSLTACPLTITYAWAKKSDKATLISGVLGFRQHC